MRSVWTALAAVALAATVTGAAHADGLPGPGIDAGPEGVEELAGAARYVTVRAGAGTVAVRVEQRGGRVTASRFLRGRFAIPVVAYDGSAAGVAADGRTLVLVRPREKFPRAATTFAVLDAARLKIREIVTLRGDFSFDALSPDGRLLYLVQYVSPRDFTRYRVRAFDLAAGRLLRKPVVDPRETATMRGSPVTRETSPDGRWAYTLYDGAGGHPFIHALDTAARRAVCIDLHALEGFKRIYDVRLRVASDGSTITVHDSTEPIAVVDTSTFRVSAPRPAPTARPARKTADSGRPEWLFVPPAALVLAAGLTLALRSRRRTVRSSGGLAAADRERHDRGHGGPAVEPASNGHDVHELVPAELRRVEDGAIRRRVVDRKPLPRAARSLDPEGDADRGASARGGSRQPVVAERVRHDAQNWRGRHRLR
jgi:hypothetical protein